MIEEKLNIHQKINAVMADCDYLQKKDAQQGKGIRYDEVMAMIRELLIKHGIVMICKQTDMQSLPVVEGTKQRVYQGEYSLSLVNMDDPSQVVTHTAFAHGMDGGDKGAGKAHTYAMKTMLVKGFGIETGEDEESRSEKLENARPISEKDAAMVKKRMAELNVDAGAFLRILNSADVDSMPASFLPRAVQMLDKKEAQNGNS